MTAPQRSWVAQVFGLFFALIGGVMSVGSVGAYLRDTGIAANGARGWARVERTSVSRSTEEGNEYRVRYRFAADDGRALVAERGVPKRVWRGLKPGDSVLVMYAPEQPTRNFPAEGGGVRSVGVLVLAVVIGVVFVGLGGGIVVGVVRGSGHGP